MSVSAGKDITGQPENRDALSQSEIRYRRLFEAAHDGVLILDSVSRKIIDANPFMVNLLGYPREELLGKELWEIGLLKDEQASHAAFRELQQKGQVRYEDFPLESKTGDKREVEIVANRYDEGGTQVIQCNIRDITERKRIEEVLRASEERFRTLFQLGPAAIYSCDASGVIQEFNRRAEELWGRTPAEGDTDERFCGSFKLFRPDGSFMPHDQCPMAEVIAGKITAAHDMEVLIERPDNSRVTVVVNIRPLKDKQGKVTGAINCFYDITERKQTEDTIARLAAIVESSDDAIVSKDLNGVILSWNAGAERIFGYTDREAIGQPVTMLMTPERADEEPDILKRISRGERVEHYETVRRRKDGSLLDVSLTISPIVDGRGNVIGASKSARDISARKQAEERQRLLMGELVHRGANQMAVIQSIISRSLPGARPLAEERETLKQRLQALARTRSVLTSKGFGAPVAEIIRLEFEAFSKRVNAVGPDVMLNSKAAQTFALLVHELATNATKYGALSKPKKGQVDIRWSIEGAGEEARFKFLWQERDGPPVVSPARKGFGSMLLDKVVAQDFAAKPRIKFAPEGVSYEIDAALLVMTTPKTDLLSNA